MNKNLKISVAQLFTMLVISRIILTLVYNESMFKTECVYDNVIAIIISFFTTFLLITPLYLLHKQNANFCIADNLNLAFGKLGTFILILYGIYYIFVCCYSLSLFNIFISNVVGPSISIKKLSLWIIITACYAAYKGLEGLARASSIIAALMIIAAAFLFFALIPKIDFLHFTPLLYEGPSEIFNLCCLILSRMSCIVAMNMILPYAKGNIKKGMFFWNTILHVFSILIIVVLVGALGEYTKFHVFPIYAATGIAEIGVFKRLNAIYLGIFTMGLFIKISLYLSIFSITVNRIFKKCCNKFSIVAGGIFVFLLGIIFSNLEDLDMILYKPQIFIFFTITLGFLIPLLVLIINTIKKKRGINCENSN